MGRGSELCSNCAAGCPGGSTCEADEQPEHEVTVSEFFLDKYEVTVGRFKKFVEAYNGLGRPPPTNSGAHPEISGSGWQAAYNVSLPADRGALEKNLACTTAASFTQDDDRLPITCVDWYLAFAFCIWDGGRLPTEAEWEYAAAGGDEERLYPWGSTPAPSCGLLNYQNCVGNVTEVGRFGAGEARWGHMDLLGNVWEWMLDEYVADWYANALASGSDVASLPAAGNRSTRAGSWQDGLAYDRSAARSATPPNYRSAANVGVRCARSIEPPSAVAGGGEGGAGSNEPVLVPNGSFELDPPGTEDSAITDWELELYASDGSPPATAVHTLDISSDRAFVGEQSLHSFLRNVTGYAANTRAATQEASLELPFSAAGDRLTLWRSDLRFTTSSRYNWQLLVILSDGSQSVETLLACRCWGSSEGCAGNAQDISDATDLGADGQLWYHYTVEIPEGMDRSNLTITLRHEQDSWDSSTAESELYFDAVATE